MGLGGEVKRVAFVCDVPSEKHPKGCGRGQRGDVDGQRSESGELHAKHREWDGVTTVDLIDGKGTCAGCGVVVGGKA